MSSQWDRSRLGCGKIPFLADLWTMLNLKKLRLSRDPRGVLAVTFDVPGRTDNRLSQDVLVELEVLLAELEKDRTIRLVLFQSGNQSGFLPGGNIREILAVDGPQKAEELVRAGQGLLNRLERMAVPTVAVLCGPCLGPNIEFAIACRYRLARDDHETRLGLSEVRRGCLPAFGGTQRLPELVGLTDALPMLLTGKTIDARHAVDIGLVDAACPADAFAESVEQFVDDVLAGRIPPHRRALLPEQPGGWALLRAAQRRLAERGRHDPALPAILKAISQGLSLGREAGMDDERRSLIELLFNPERSRRHERFARRALSDTQNPWVDGLTIGAALTETARRFPDRDALVCPQADVRLSWSQFDQAVDRLARGLLALGLRPGDHFGVWATNLPHWTLLQFATARIGVVLVTINPAYRPAELEYALRQSEVRGLAITDRFKTSDYVASLLSICPELDTSPPGQLRSDRLPRLQWVVQLQGTQHPGMLSWQQLQDAAEEVSPDKLQQLQPLLAPGDPINLQYTSGTTGLPKGALLSHRNLLLNALFAAEGQRLDHRDRICIPVPLYHCFGCVLGTMCAAVTGAAMVFPSESFDPKLTLDAIESQRCTVIYGVPTMFIAELEHPSFKGRDLASLRTGIMAGSPCPIELMKRVVREMGASEITIAYGQTEASPLITMTRTDDPLELRVSTVGRPLPGIEVRVVDPVGGEPLPDGQHGELCCRGHNVMLGYYRLPDQTSAAIDADGWLHTGDTAVRQPDGYFRITGRIKELIVRGGEKIAPREIEELLYEHPKVQQVSVVGVPDRKFGEEILAWVKLRPDTSATENEIRDYCRERLAHYKTPRYVKFVDTFPMTVTGKIQKYKISQQAIDELGLRDAAAIETA